MKRNLVKLIVLILCSSCKSHTVFQASEIEDIKSVIDAIGDYGKKERRIYKKSFQDDYYNSNFIANIASMDISVLNQEDLKKAQKIKDSLKLKGVYSRFEVDSISNILARPFLNPMVEDFLAQGDIEKMKKTFMDESIKWPGKMFEHVEITNNKNDVHISYPVFNIDNTIALIFFNYNNSLSLEFYEKKGGVWVWKGGSLLWRAD